MEWIDPQLVDFLKSFGDGNTLVLAYIAISFMRMVIKPIYSNGKKIVSFIDAYTKALNEGVSSSHKIVAEFKTLNEILKNS